MTKNRNIPTPAEDAIRPGHEAVSSRLTKARDELATAQQAEADAQAKIDAHEALADTKTAKPKDWAHDLAELEGSLRWASKRAALKRQELAEAEREMVAADRALALARMEDRAAVIAGFDRDEFIARYQEKMVPLKEELWSEIHLLEDLEREVAEIAKAAGIDRGDERYTPPPVSASSTERHMFDGIDLHPASLTSNTVEEALAVGDDPRIEAAREAYFAELTAKRDAEERERREERERIAEYEAHRERLARASGHRPRPIQYSDGARPMKTSRLAPGLRPNG
ncbi:hypothetical protein [Brevibacterium casei]|uniref:Uncharacterized protein n=1 Tax=Brevibacterium casei TaxID=33889 RepID=A0A7T4A1G3_9MICO|nr:hypothetical protein [Brevibacterium casei]QQB15570.1 hypothetical protein I6H47_06470 [Brevibacterium casei]